jgi:steroid 5-alpha reductase family enzyme
MGEFLNCFLPACVFAVTLMLALWWVSLRIHNLGIVDIAWSAGFAPIAIFYALATHGDPVRRAVMAGMAGIWSIRLGAHVGSRVLSQHPREDGRYEQLRAEWGARLKQKAFWFFEIQAVLIAVLSLPFLLVCLNQRPGLAPVEWAGMALWLVAVAGESLADFQLRQFKANPANRGHVCQVGLWRHSRHPNYFFEWLIWVAFYLFAVGSPLGCATIYCPALMLYFLLRVTGIPMTEQLAVKTKGAEYREYQRTTSGFVPWFRKGSG